MHAIESVVKNVTEICQKYFHTNMISLIKFLGKEQKGEIVNKNVMFK